TPGLLDGGHEFYTPGSALRLLEVLENFQGGRVVIGVTSLPFKCPPAPSEAALLLHDFLTERGRRHRSEISLVTPQPAPIPPSTRAASSLCSTMAARCPTTFSSAFPSTVSLPSSPNPGSPSTAGFRCTR